MTECEFRDSCAFTGRCFPCGDEPLHSKLPCLAVMLSTSVTKTPSPSSLSPWVVTAPAGGLSSGHISQEDTPSLEKRGVLWEVYWEDTPALRWTRYPTQNFVGNWPVVTCHQKAVPVWPHAHWMRCATRCRKNGARSHFVACCIMGCSLPAV